MGVYNAQSENSICNDQEGIENVGLFLPFEVFSFT